MNPILANPEITTPAFIIERSVVRKNCDAMREKAQRSGVVFRPHVKTHKTAEIARMQFGGGTGPITVSTLAEAEFFAGHGFHDITYAVPIGLGKLERAAALAGRIKRLNLLLDSFEALHALEEFCSRQETAFHVFLKIDCGYHRAGVDPESPDALRLADAMAKFKCVRFEGLLTHAGHSYHAHNVEEIRKIAAQETSALTGFQTKLKDQRTNHLVRSTGS